MMKNLALFFWFFLLSAALISPRFSSAMEIPGYIDPQKDIPANVESIIQALTSEAEGITGAIDDEEFNNIMLRKLSAALYAEALTTRTQLIKEAKEKSKKKITSAIKDKKAVVSEEVQTYLRKIAERINAIVSLEAGIANLEGTTVFATMPKINSAVGPDAKDEGE